MAVSKVFSQNLALLCQNAGTITKISNDIGVSRIQMSRYLKGESHPKPADLKLICDYFNVDARIYVEPLHEVSGQLRHTSPIFQNLDGFSISNILNDPKSPVEDGVYTIFRRSMAYPKKFLLNVFTVKTFGQWSFIRGSDPADIQRSIVGTTSVRGREFRGLIVPQESKAVFVIGSRGMTSVEVLVLQKETSGPLPYWVGSCLNPEADGEKFWVTTPVIVEPVAPDCRNLRHVMKLKGYYDEDQLSAHHKDILSRVFH